jgi:RHS repeat-associated protein
MRVDCDAALSRGLTAVRLRSWFWGIATLGCLCVAVVVPAGASAAASAGFESPGVRAALSRQLQGPGPIVDPTGGSGTAAAPEGEPVASLSTAYSNTWQSSRGRRVTRIYSSPVNYKASDSSWHPINTSLVSGVGGYENAANSFWLRIPESLSASVSIASEGHSLAFTLAGASMAIPTVSGSTASYREVLPSTDLSYVSDPSGVEELATLNDSAAPDSLTYQLSGSQGLLPRQQPNGSIAFVDEEGSSWFTIPAPVAFASAAGPGQGRALPMSIRASQSGWLISVDTGEAWLREALAEGPVVVDPTVTAKGSSGGCTLAAEAPTTSQCSASTLQVGYAESHEEHHALIGFPVGSIPVGSVVVHATLGAYLESHSTTKAKAVGVYPVTRSWKSPTWDTYEGEHDWTTPGGDYSNPGEGSDAVVNPSVGTATGWYYWYPTKMVQKWVNGSAAPSGEGYADDGLIMKDETDNHTANLLSFVSPSVATNAPYLEVFYAERGQGIQPQYTILSTPLTNRSTMGVNVASGDLLISNNDMSMQGVASLGFSSLRTWNGLNLEQSQYGDWTDSNYNQNEAVVYPEGSVAVEGPTGGWFTFIRQANGTYLTPPGIKAEMCETATPCPKALPTGSKYQLTYDENGDYVDFSETGVGSGVHDRFGNAIAVEHPSSERTVYTDTHGHKVEELSNSHGDTTEIKDVSGARKTKYAYESASPYRLHIYTDANGKTTTYQYGSLGHISLIVAPDGEETTFSYAEGNISPKVAQIERGAKSGEPAITKFSYYEGSEVPSACKGTPKATQVRDPDWSKSGSHETLYCANQLDEIERTLDANGNETTATYDQYANNTSVTAPARETGAARGVTSFVYGTGGMNLGCEIQGTSGEPLTKCPETPLEQGYSTEARYKDTTFLHQPTETLSAQRDATSLCYYGGAKCAEKEKEGATGTGGALKQETEPGEPKSTTYNSYEPDGNLSSSTDFNGNTTDYEYEGGSLKTVIPPSGSGVGKETITVDADDRPHIIVRCLAESSCTSSDTTTLTYNALDLVTEAVYTGPGATKTIKYTYNANGALEKMIDPTGTTTYTLNALGRITEEALPGAVSNAYSYDAAANLVSFTDAGGTTHYAYNGLNELESMYEPGGTCTGTPAKCTTFTYDDDGSLTKTTYASGASMRYKLASTTGRVLTAEADSPKGETLVSNKDEYYELTKGTPDTPLIFRDTYSGPGGVTAETDYTYDALDQLTQALSKSTTAAYKSCYDYHYNPVGNISYEETTPLSQECEGNYVKDFYNAGNQLTCRMQGPVKACAEEGAVENAAYAYNGAGDETAITGHHEPENTAFGYNNVNQLEGLTPPGKAEEKLKYLGSGQGKLAGLGTSTLQNSALGITKQTIEGNASYYARTPDGTLIDERLPGSISYNPIYDAQGDIIGLLNTAGELVQTIRYGPYGENANATKIVEHGEYSPTNDPFMFQGGYHTPGGNAGAGNVPNGLYHFGARYYDPTVARWTQPDPANASPEFGLENDDPVNEVDPTGEKGGPGIGQCYKRRNGPEKCIKAGTGFGKGIDWTEVWNVIKRLAEVHGDPICQTGISGCLAPLYVVLDAGDCVGSEFVECQPIDSDISEYFK